MCEGGGRGGGAYLASKLQSKAQQIIFLLLLLFYSFSCLSRVGCVFIISRSLEPSHTVLMRATNRDNKCACPFAIFARPPLSLSLRVCVRVCVCVGWQDSRHVGK